MPQGLSRRTIAIIATLAIEALILLVLLSLGVRTGPAPQEAAQVTTFDASDANEAAAEDQQSAAEPEQIVTAAPQAQPQPQAAPIIQPPSALPQPISTPAPVTPPQPQAAPAPADPSRARAVIREGSNYGPADSGGRSGGGDSQIVGTAPDGSPLYAARWYREPRDAELAGYLSTAEGPGWGLIACKTAPGWRVEDCVILSESPAGSNIARSAHAAAWQFQVRPPRVGGEYLVGAWVRIRLDYGTRQGPRR